MGPSSCPRSSGVMARPSAIALPAVTTQAARYSHNLFFTTTPGRPGLHFAARDPCSPRSHSPSPPMCEFMSLSGGVHRHDGHPPARVNFGEEESPCMSSQSQHERHMYRCVELARQAMESGDAPVGSLIIHGDDLVSEGVESVRAR